MNPIWTIAGQFMTLLIITYKTLDHEFTVFFITYFRQYTSRILFPRMKTSAHTHLIILLSQEMSERRMQTPVVCYCESEKKKKKNIYSHLPKYNARRMHLNLENDEVVICINSLANFERVSAFFGIDVQCASTSWPKHTTNDRRSGSYKLATDGLQSKTHS